MAITFFSAKDFNPKLKVTVQSTGRLGFTDQTAKALGLSENTYIKIGAEGPGTDTMYMVLCEKDEDAFRVGKAGNYYFLPTNLLFDSLKLDFRSKSRTIMYDLSRASELDGELSGTVYRMSKRVKERRKREM